ncbi:MAG TPA: hypothetical protein VGJ60_07745 [Chloroflexota bacterium]|jgi:hypothetical protein
MASGFKCGAARDLPLNTSKAWDGGAAAKSIFEANSDSDGNPTSGARRGFLAYDADAPDQRGSYKLPFAMVLNGRLTALASGLRAAASRLPQTDGLSTETRNAARSVIDGYMKKMHSGDEERWMAPYASIVPLERNVGAMLLADSAEQLPESLVRQLHDPSVVQDTPLYWFRSVASNAAEDHYGTVMQTDSLRNYAQDAEDGLPFCNSHQHEELPFGRTFEGKFHQGRGQNLARTEMDVYVPYDMNVNGVDTTHFIKAVRSGVARDVSIGFEPERIVCSLDGRNMPRNLLELLTADPEDPNAPCRHIPGVTYVHEGKKQRALGKIYGAHCLELSPVFRGATPGAGIISPSRALVVDERGGPPAWALHTPSLRTAALLAEADLLDRQTALLLEEHTRGVHFPDVTARRYVLDVGPDDDWDVERAVKKPTDDDPDPDGDGDDDRTPEGDTDHSHWTPDGKPKFRRVVPDDTEDDPGPQPPDPEPMPEPQPEPDPNPEPQEVRASMTSTAPADPESAVHEGPASSGAAALSSSAAAPPASEAPPPASRAAPEPAAPAAAAVVPIWHAEVRGALIESQLAPDGFDGDPLTRLRELGRELEVERTWGGWGRRYREELCRDIEAEGVRAFGAETWSSSRAAYVPIIERGTADDLLALRKHFQEQAAQRLRGGRVTRDDDPSATPRSEDIASANPRKVPSYAYRS